ncbi:MAG TPA: ATP-binding protein [Bacteroidales bacterium]|nr:ATP-binding protein [Bacteroidales bacterium]
MKTPFQRVHIETLSKRLKEPRRFIQVITGPRQVGKTTLMNQFLKEYKQPYHYVSADAVMAAGENWLLQQWESARLKWQHSGAEEFLLVIDEVQKAGNWAETVKKLWDEDTWEHRPIRVVVLGSSRLLIQKGLTESLAGRFELIRMGHWSLTEMQQAFGWNENQYVWFGGYPGSAQLIADESRWKSYIVDSLVDTSISRDILMLTRINKPALLRRLFELGCLYSGQILSYTKILGQMADAGNTTTLAHYLELLDTAGLLAGLEKYSQNPIRQRSSSPKFQVYNNALLSAGHAETFKQAVSNPALWGRMVESAVGAHLLNHSKEEGFDVFYWRQGNVEVDFIIVRQGQAVTLEVKSSFSPKVSGMNAFIGSFQSVRSYLIGNEGIRWQEFFFRPEPNRYHFLK